MWLNAMKYQVAQPLAVNYNKNYTNMKSEDQLYPLTITVTSLFFLTSRKPVVINDIGGSSPIQISVQKDQEIAIYIKHQKS